MARIFKVQDYKDGKSIQMSSPLSSRTRFLPFFYSIIFLIAAFAFGNMLLTEWGKNSMASFISLLGMVAFSIGFYRFINKATETEKLIINGERLDIINTSLLKVA